MTLHLSTGEARHVAAALHALTAVHEFDGVEAWRTEAGAAVRRAFGGERTLLCLPPCRATDAPHAAVVGGCSGEAVPPEIVTRIEAMFRAGVDRSDDPAAADMVDILGACSAAGLDAFTGPSFVAEASARLGLSFDARRSPFVREIIEPCGLWHGPQLRAHGPGYAVVLGTSAPRLRGRRTEAGTRLLATLLQPAFAAGVRAATTRWGTFVTTPAGPAVPDPARRPPRPTTVVVPTGSRLTPREREVAALLAARRTNGEIAAALGVSPHTARHHTERVLRKYGVSSRRRVPPDHA
jgi:DNA-binding CsgD family transcriptional regulator